MPGAPRQRCTCSRAFACTVRARRAPGGVAPSAASAVPRERAEVLAPTIVDQLLVPDLPGGRDDDPVGPIARLQEAQEVRRDRSARRSRAVPEIGRDERMPRPEAPG